MITQDPELGRTLAVLLFQVLALLFWLGPLLIVARMQNLNWRWIALCLIPIIGVVALIALVILKAERKFQEVT